MTKKNIAIVGAAGYSGEELLRILQYHPEINITCITSRKYAGQPIGNVFPRFAESSLTFCQPDVAEIAKSADLVFLALPHGLAAEFAIPLLDAGLKVIDISADFRLRSTQKYETYYKTPHPAPETLKEAVYGLPERYRSSIINANLIACAGCYPTSIILPTSAILAAELAESTGIMAMSMSGVSGAGRKVDLPFIFPECNESVRPYGVSGHRHLPEIEQELAVASSLTDLQISFIPHLVPVNRGIHSSILLDAKVGVTTEKIGAALNKAYANEPFVRILPAGKLADTKHITMTNMCEIGYVYDEHTNKIILSSAIDNLTKGASGQAVQCMNLIFGFAETCGLR